MRKSPSENTRSARPLDQRELRKHPGYLLARARFVAFKAFEVAVRESCNIRPVEFSVLLLLAGNEQVTQTQLSQALGVAPPNMTGILRRLEQRALIARERAAQDGRQQFITLTAAGLAMTREAQVAIRASDRQWLTRLSRGEQAMLSELLEKIVSAPED